MIRNSDEGHRLTDAQLAALEKRIARVYSQAAKEVQGEVNAYFQAFAKRDAEQRQRLDAGEITTQQYKQWRLAQMGRGKRFAALRDRLAERMTQANETAAAYMNDATPGIYSLNRNYAAYTIEQVAGDVGFTLWDEQTAKRLLTEQPDLMPYYPPARAVKRGIDLAWGKKQITAQVTSGILMGESIGKLADRLQRNIPDMNRTSAIRAARTAVTGAECAGRQDTYLAAEKMGLKLRKRWLATLDGRTRHAHALLDGQTAAPGKPFTVDGYELMFPGDKSAPAYLVYNCRCMVVADLDGVDTSDAQRRARDPETGESVIIRDMSYSEWAGWKEMTRRKIGKQGQEIIDKPTYNKLTRDFLRRGGVIVRGELAERRLSKMGAYASYWRGANAAFIRDEATVSDVLEEMYHAEQDRKHAYSDKDDELLTVLREIDAQKYLISVAKRYKIPIEEQLVTQKNLEDYEKQLKEIQRRSGQI